ncbi:hypothetical protein Pstr01_22650 [Pseudomonas straminea]|nr:hypothetical protein Pstr01_22650 [Pseudomonas straminea]
MGETHQIAMGFTYAARPILRPVGTGGDAQSMPAIFRAHGVLAQWIGERLLPPLSYRIDEPGLKDRPALTQCALIASTATAKSREGPSVSYVPSLSERWRSKPAMGRITRRED